MRRGVAPADAGPLKGLAYTGRIAMDITSRLVACPSQTVGPFFDFALTADPSLGCMAADGARGERIRLAIRLFDGDGAPLPDAMIELWQADASGKYDHPEDRQEKSPDPAFRGFGRLGTDTSGLCAFHTVRPGAAPGPGGSAQAPHINVHVFGRGLLMHLFTRIYFADDPDNQRDPILNLVPEERRATLLAHPDPRIPGTWNFEIRLCGERETVFFDA
jgi:protocatechuate 3,4-dioxygenase alpha subunit